MWKKGRAGTNLKNIWAKDWKYLTWNLLLWLKTTTYGEFGIKFCLLNTNPPITVQSSFYLEVKKDKKVTETLENAEEVCTPNIVLAETARKCLREGNYEKTVTEWLDLITTASNIVQIYPTLALQVAKCQSELFKREKRFRQNMPSLFYAIVLAIARINMCKILTGDECFKDFPKLYG